MAGQTRVGFIGLGSMGSGMAGRVLDGGYPLTVYNRTRERAAALAARGAAVAATPRELAERSDVLITMLADPAAVRAVLGGPDGILAGARDGQVLVEMSTVGPAEARGTIERAAAHGLAVIHAPVLGPPSAAAEGGLTILAGGGAQRIEAQRPLLSTMGGTIVILETNEQACALKLAMNAMLLASLQLTGEAVALATGWGIPRQQVLAFFGGSPLLSAPVKARIGAMYETGAPANFSLALGRKDLWLAAAAAYEVGASTPIIAAALETYSLAMRDHRNEDIARIAGFLADMAMPDTTPR